MAERRLVYVLNPAAGHGKYLPEARRAAEAAHANEIHLTEGVCDCTNYIAEVCVRDPDTHFVVYGGDGTAGEAVTGIMRAGAGNRALFTAVPCGSGNDFIRGIAEFSPLPGEEHILLDLISVNGRYVLNMLNIGFDCDVVIASENMRRRRFVPNGLSYILGVGSVLAHKKSFHAALDLGGVWEHGCDSLKDEHIEGEFLLTSAGNLPFCGGGFKAAAAADPSDGFMDLLLVRDLSRARFVSLVGDYRKGTHVNPETWTPCPAFRDILEYKRCRSLQMDGVSHICLDGEVIPVSGVRAEVVPRAIRYLPSAKPGDRR